MSQGTTVLGLSELTPPSTVVGMAELGLPAAWLGAVVVVTITSEDDGVIIEARELLSNIVSSTQQATGGEQSGASTSVVQADAGLASDIRQLLQNLLEALQTGGGGEGPHSYREIALEQTGQGVDLKELTTLLKVIEQALSTESTAYSVDIIALPDTALGDDLAAALQVQLQRDEAGTGAGNVVWTLLYRVSSESGVGAERIAQRLVESLSAEQGQGSGSLENVAATILVFEAGGDGTEERVYVAVMGAPWGWLHFQLDGTDSKKKVKVPFVRRT